MGIFFFAPLLCPRAAFETSVLIEAPPNPGIAEPPFASCTAAAAIPGIAAAASKPLPVADKNFRRSMFESFRALSFKVASAAHHIESCERRHYIRAFCTRRHFPLCFLFEVERKAGMGR